MIQHQLQHVSNEELFFFISISNLDHTDDIPSIMAQKQKSLLSVYDNNPLQQSTINSYSLVGIIGRNKRSEAFTKRLLLSGFLKPILCDMNSTDVDRNDKSNYVTYETFYELSPSIILITDDLTKSFEDLFPQNNQQLIIDTRETCSKKTSILSSLSIPNSYRAFGNLSNWEIENGTQRIGIAVEQNPPLNLIKFIHDLNSFPRGIYFLDQYAYNKKQIQSFRNCLFPFISTMIICCLYFILSLIEHRNDSYSSVLIYRQASSITASTSITLLALLFLIRPTLALIEFIYSTILNQPNTNGKFLKILFPLNKNLFYLENLTLIQHWLKSRRYLSWYSLSFALLHIIFLIFSKIDFNSKLYIYAFLFGVLTLIFLSILSFVHFPWISERLLWNEYHFLTAYFGPCCLLIGFIHVFLHWQFQSDLFNLKFVSMILPLVVIILRFIIYGIIQPIKKHMNVV
jgi:hypothetical protein